MIQLCNKVDRPEDVGYALAHPGRGLRQAADEFLELYESDRRSKVRQAVLYARLFKDHDHPREVLREIRRVAALPGKPHWPTIQDVLDRLWARHPREMFRLMPGWLTHRDAWRRWAALQGLQYPARKDPRSVLKVMRLLRGEKHVRVRRLLGEVLTDGLYLKHPEPALVEMARWLSDGARAAGSVTRQAEKFLDQSLQEGTVSNRQRSRLKRVARDLEDHHAAPVRAHARRLLRSLEN
ncbi:MAG: hypothetical protein HKN21_06540 [Candidatus Eisenbacteria bacterium]|uniref:HEAT repeat domain-containing protein n=1 Tax=Eiseniibacteriota bacterium TaxID=2212470 RepID=A0A7Y2E827_UNCEI|nr:hypothetical protein [Candidatus Eisenbacteria bacterium]